MSMLPSFRSILQQHKFCPSSSTHDLKQSAPVIHQKCHVNKQSLDKKGRRQRKNGHSRISKKLNYVGRLALLQNLNFMEQSSLFPLPSTFDYFHSGICSSHFCPACSWPLSQSVSYSLSISIHALESLEHLAKLTAWH